MKAEVCWYFDINMAIKTTNGLMKHLRDHGIDINGSTEKRQLRNLGYYHLYKGYRFYRVSANRLPFTDFEKIHRTYEYDIELKNLLYRWTIFLETAFKNVILQSTIEFIKSDKIRDFYDNALESGPTLPVNAKQKEKKDATSSKLGEIRFLQNKILESYNHKNPIIQHHYDQSDQVPIWGLFEILMFGDLGQLTRCLKLDLRKKISQEIGLNLQNDKEARMLEHYIFLIKDLRNAIAHDNVVYDGRFIQNTKAKGLRNDCITYLENKTSIKGINFNTIEDILILVCYLLKLLGVQKRQIKSLVNSYISLTKDFIADMNDPAITSKQIRSDTLSKANKILAFL